MVGTPMYVAPEIMRFDPYGKKVDVYSMSVLLAELACGVDHVHIQQQFRRVGRMAAVNGWRPRLLKRFGIPPPLAELIQQCWSPNPDDRPTFVEIRASLNNLGPDLHFVHEDSASSHRELLAEIDDVDELRDMAVLLRASEFSLKMAKRKIEEQAQIIAELKARAMSGEVDVEEDEYGILGGMLIYEPDKERSVLGRGAFGTIRKMVNPHDHQVYAVKELSNLTLEDGSTDEVAMNELLDEVRKMGVVRSEFIVQYRTSAVWQGRFYVMMDPILGVDFRDVVVARQATGVHFANEQVAAWGLQLALGLSHLHDECSLVHQDLHNGNVMITGLCKDADGTISVDDILLSTTSVKILDLGLASFKSDHAHHTCTMRMGTMRAMRTQAATKKDACVELNADDVGGFKAIRAPEMHPRVPHGRVRFDAKIDVWALGMLLTEAILLLPIEE